jgi:MFS transporter, MHS family, proline/betaine transporter
VGLASLGGALEYYDFIVYAIFARSIAFAFFPTTRPLTSLMLSFAVFAAGYCARPIGGVILSHFGDKYGRRRAFIVSMLFMSLSTLAIGLLPSYSQAGVIASFAMVALRMTQGFCLGGELPGAITYVVESTPRKAGLACGLVFCCVNSGVLLAAAVGLSVHAYLSAGRVATWGWRIGFLVGGLLGLLSFVMRLRLEETPGFARLRDRAHGYPIGEVLRNYPRQVVTGVGALATMAGFNGLLFAQWSGYLTEILGYSSIQAIRAQNLCLATISAGMLVAAWLGDWLPRRLILGAGALLLLIFAVPFYGALAARSLHLETLALLAALPAAAGNGTFAAIAADLFPTRVRFSGVGIVLNLSVTLFSGFGPLLATWLVSASGSVVAPGYFMAGCALIALSSVIPLARYEGQILRELNQNPTS